MDTRNEGNGSGSRACTRADATSPLRRAARRVIALLAACTLGGCLAPWPLDESDTMVWHVPTPLASREEALGAIRNSQGSFVSLDGGDVIAVEADDIGLRFRTERIVTYSTSRGVTGGYFAGTTYVPTYHTVRDTHQDVDRDWTVIPLRDVSYLLLKYGRRNDWKNRWCAVVGFHDPSRADVVLRAKDKATAVTLVDSICTLADAAGADFVRTHVGLSFKDLTDEQWQSLGRSGPRHGVYVHQVYQGGPAERAGFRWLDVIVAVNGTRIGGYEHLSQVLHARPPSTPFVCEVVRHQGLGTPQTMQLTWAP